MVHSRRRVNIFEDILAIVLPSRSAVEADPLWRINLDWFNYDFCLNTTLVAATGVQICQNHAACS